ncbi:hypothetical protein Taro_025821 [Colocasia esculenta]|uniref:RRM domain-containing protein n=1 Tax=Colocasia esculenta TaxID=4460 RepID=A0A843V4F7_COLES|nr:hypothetical protein [Colocasia esculenta]
MKSQLVGVFPCAWPPPPRSKLYEDAVHEPQMSSYTPKESHTMERGLRQRRHHTKGRKHAEKSTTTRVNTLHHKALKTSHYHTSQAPPRRKTHRGVGGGEESPDFPINRIQSGLTAVSLGSAACDLCAGVVTSICFLFSQSALVAASSFPASLCSIVALPLTQRETTTMADPFWGYPAGRDPRAAFPGYVPSENPGLASHGFYGNIELHGAASDHLQRDAIGNPARSVVGGFPGANIRAFTPLEDPALVRHDSALDVKSSIAVVEPSSALEKDEGLPKEWPGILFVDGIPTDCTRREAAHLFRPFIGFKDIKVFHKEPRRSGDKARVLCFVEFTDANCASTAMEALQGYKFDDKKPDAPVLRIQFAQFPFHPPARN